MAVSKDEVLDAIAKMSVIEVVELIADMEKKFGVTAAAPVALAAGPAAGGAAAAPVEEQTEFHRHAQGVPGRQEGHRHQGDPRDHRTGPQGSQGPGRGRALDGQGIHLQGRRRSNQEKTRRRWREGGGQITSMVRLGTRASCSGCLQRVSRAGALPAFAGGVSPRARSCIARKTRCPTHLLRKSACGRIRQTAEHSRGALSAGHSARLLPQLPAGGNGGGRALKYRPACGIQKRVSDLQLLGERGARVRQLPARPSRCSTSRNASCAG